jgi:COX assembly protein 2
VRHHFQPPAQSPISNTPPACAEVVAALDECHARGFLWKVTGNCTDAKYKVLRGLRLERTRQNREEAKEKRERIEKVWKELDDNK